MRATVLYAARDIRVEDRPEPTIQRPTDAVIRLAGNSQDGIQTAGAFLARLAGRSEHDVMTYMTIPATISGGPSIFQVRIGSGEVLSAGDEAEERRLAGAVPADDAPSLARGDDEGDAGEDRSRAEVDGGVGDRKLGQGLR